MSETCLSVPFMVLFAEQSQAIVRFSRGRVSLIDLDPSWCSGKRTECSVITCLITEM